MTMPLPNRSASRNQSGFSMVELMVAIVLGLFLSTAVLQTFLSAKQTYEFQQELSMLQQNGRFAMEFLSRDIRAANFWGCRKNVTKRSILTGDSNPAVFAGGLIGFDNVAAATTGFTALFGGNQPDAIVLQGGRGGGIAVTATASTAAANLRLKQLSHPDGSQIRAGDILLVADCLNAVIFQASQTQGSDRVWHQQTATAPRNSTANLGAVFTDDALLYRADAIRYWVRSGTSGEPVLVRGTDTDLWTGGDELVEGVENLQILYGEDTTASGIPNYFVPADNVSDMKNVVSVQIHLALRSLRDNMLDAPQSLAYYGGPKLANDRRMRTIFTSTIALRNRLN